MANLRSRSFQKIQCLNYLIKGMNYMVNHGIKKLDKYVIAGILLCIYKVLDCGLNDIIETVQ